MEAYHVNVDSKSYFMANSFEIRPGVRIVDIRSIRGCIGGEAFDSKDERLRKVIREYISTTDNVELINILSREYNEYNWFEAYDESYNSNLEYSKERLLKNEISEVSGNPDTSQIVRIERFIKNVRSSRGDKLLPNALYAYLHEGLPRNEKLDIESLDFVPVWYINGAQHARADTCELFCCFEILIHILAKRFIDFKAKLLKLASTDIQLAKAKNQTLERYQHLTQLELIDRIEKLEAKKQGLKKKNKSLEDRLEEINAKLDTQTQALNDANAKLDEAAQREQQAHEERQHLINQNNQLQTTITNLQDVVVESGQILHDEFQAAKNEFRERFNQLNVTTSSRIETIDVWRIRALDEYYHQTHQCQENENVLDTFCGDAEKSIRINQHRFKPQNTDELIGSYPNANAIDLAVYLRRHHDEYPHVRMDRNRKLVYSDNEIDEVRNLLLAYSQTRETITAVVDRMDERYQDASDSLIARLQTALHPIAQAQNQIIANQQAQQQQQAIMQAQIQELQQHEQEHHHQQQQAINNLADEVHELKISFVEFRNRKPRCRELLHRSRYRLIGSDEDGNAYCEDTKNGPRYYLTEHDLAHGRFR